MSVNRGLIQNDKYFTQVGQLRTMTKTKYGETSLTTIPCLVYQEEDKESQTTPAVGTRTRHFACFSNTFVASEGDHLTAVVDQFGIPVITDSRIVKINDYNSFRHGSRFHRFELDIKLV